MNRDSQERQCYAKTPWIWMTAHLTLRARTSAAHATIDAVFSKFDLSDRVSYIGFLKAHARVVPAIEAVLTDAKLPLPRPRAILLKRDLEAFDHYLPPPLRIKKSLSTAEKWGLLYVLEGSRLGGRLLLRRVAPGFSSEYLSAVQEPNEWRNFTQTLNNRAMLSAAWLESAVNGAILGFSFFADSASKSLIVQ